MFKRELLEWEHRSDVELHLTVDAPDQEWGACVGIVANLFPEVKVDPRNTVAAIIGPPVMYKSVIGQCKAKGLANGNIWVSFERRMRCGVGKCGHCQMNHIYTCQRGPAFMYTEIQGLEEAFA
jgi:NAD(P)H-flavin reductase